MALSFDAFRRVIGHLGQLLLLRADLAAEELAAARQRWFGWIFAALAAIGLLTVAVAAAAAWLTLLLWDRFGISTLAVLALFFGAAALLLMRAVLVSARSAPSPLAGTRAALQEDYTILSATAMPERAAEAVGRAPPAQSASPAEPPT